MLEGRERAIENLEILSHISHKGIGRDKLNYVLHLKSMLIAFKKGIRIEWLMCQSSRNNN